MTSTLRCGVLCWARVSDDGCSFVTPTAQVAPGWILPSRKGASPPSAASCRLRRSANTSRVHAAPARGAATIDGIVGQRIFRTCHRRQGCVAAAPPRHGRLRPGRRLRARSATAFHGQGRQSDFATLTLRCSRPTGRRRCRGRSAVRAVRGIGTAEGKDRKRRPGFASPADLRHGMIMLVGATLAIDPVERRPVEARALQLYRVESGALQFRVRQICAL